MRGGDHTADDACTGSAETRWTSLTANTRIQLVAGGPAGIGVQKLVRLTASAAAYSTDGWQVSDGYTTPAFNNLLPLDGSPGGTPVTGDSISILGQTLTRTATNNYVGELYVTLPPGSTNDITPIVAGAANYSFSVQAEDVTLQITANGVALNSQVVVTNGNFCVGQLVTFSTNWSNMPSGIESRSAEWTFDGNFLNDSNQPSAEASVNYTTSQAKLTNETTSAWWVSGGNPVATYSARLTESFMLSNGSIVVVSAKGLFSILRPLPTFYPEVRDTVRVGTNFGVNGELQPGYRLQFGVNSDASNVGIAFVYTNAPLDSTGSTYGRYLVIQILESFLERYNIRDGTNCAASQVDGGGLDSGDPFNNLYSEADHFQWTDAPGGGLTTASWLTITNSFRTCLMFQPKPYTDSIAVPMYSVDWAWSGTARTNGPPGTWVLVSGSPPVSPVAVDTMTFPIWSVSATNTFITTTNLPCFDEN